MAGSTFTFEKPIVIAPPQWRDSVPFADPIVPGQTLEKAQRDSEIASSVTYSNFPVDIPAEVREQLRTYQREILDYRSWASLIWWNTVLTHPSIPQDTSKESTIYRVSKVAEAGQKHMAATPWLAISEAGIQTKSFDVSVKEFHAVLIQSILEGFVSIPESGFQILEKILNSIVSAIEAKSEVEEDLAQFHVSERYEYDPIVNDIRSFIRTCLFLVTYETVEFNTKKRHEEYIKLTISYQEYNYAFNMKDWAYAATGIEEWKKNEMDDFIGNETVDLDL
ncbi:hypothetical protein ASPZODRAFT_18077 [Penicilliopsis zonata CBS 506.65]|uniref:Uncharacterized protein n=1 Tax=Penicilliopsis zonata CBS 506.65 TaxID=1073090 RepID=A0A1L9SDF8_9EURO|nr:hypothetical protein ASPZODRAFT_18077 [Penicilliopsis zonata CBS 506.65]OJJ45172.1 hypothetical protein ASPZODRAFT_18077 [Penicilliopsis zonata CBS 506.65]